MLCLLSWACLIGLLISEESPTQIDDAILLAGSVKEVFYTPGSFSISFSPFSSSQELSLPIPPGVPPPRLGAMIVISLHATDTGLVIDNLYSL